MPTSLDIRQPLRSVEHPRAAYRQPLLLRYCYRRQEAVAQGRAVPRGAGGGSIPSFKVASPIRRCRFDSCPSLSVCNRGDELALDKLSVRL